MAKDQLYVSVPKNLRARVRVLLFSLTINDLAVRRDDSYQNAWRWRWRLVRNTEHEQLLSHKSSPYLSPFRRLHFAITIIFERLLLLLLFVFSLIKQREHMYVREYM